MKAFLLGTLILISTSTSIAVTVDRFRCSTEIKDHFTGKTHIVSAPEVDVARTPSHDSYSSTVGQKSEHITLSVQNGIVNIDSSFYYKHAVRWWPGGLSTGAQMTCPAMDLSYCAGDGSPCSSLNTTCVETDPWGPNGWPSVSTDKDGIPDFNQQALGTLSGELAYGPTQNHRVSAIRKCSFIGTFK